MVVIPLPLVEGGERERESVCVCVCVCEREREREGEREASRSNAIRVGPTWLQRHSCEFVKGVALEARGGGHAKVKWGKSDLYFDAWPRPGEGEYIRDKYRMNVIMLYTARASLAIHGPEQGESGDACDAVTLPRNGQFRAHSMSTPYSHGAGRDSYLLLLNTPARFW